MTFLLSLSFFYDWQRPTVYHELKWFDLCKGGAGQDPAGADKRLPHTVIPFLTCVKEGLARTLLVLMSVSLIPILTCVKEGLARTLLVLMSVSLIPATCSRLWAITST